MRRPGLADRGELFGRSCVSAPVTSRQPSRTPKSSTGSTSGRPSVEMSSISTVQRPTPRMVERRRISSPSEIASASAALGTTPSRVRAQMSRMAATLLAEKPQARSAPSLASAEVGGAGKRAAMGFEQAAQDRAGGVAMELLVGDGADQRLERLAPLRLGGAGADAGDQPGELGLHGAEMGGGVHGWVAAPGGEGQRSCFPSRPYGARLRPGQAGPMES